MSLLGKVDVAIVDKGKEVYLPGDKLAGDVYIKVPKAIGTEFSLHAQLWGTAVYKGMQSEVNKNGKKKKNKKKKKAEEEQQQGDGDTKEMTFKAGHTYLAKQGEVTALSFHFFFDFAIPADAPASGVFKLKDHPEISAEIKYELFVWLDKGSSRGLNNPPIGDRSLCTKGVPLLVGYKAQLDPSSEPKGSISGVLKPGVLVELTLPEPAQILPGFLPIHYEINNTGNKEVETARFALYEVSTCGWLGEAGKGMTFRTQVLADHPKQESWVPKKTKRSFKEKTEVTEPYGVEVGGIANPYHEGLWTTFHEIEVSVFIKGGKKPLALRLPIKLFKKPVILVQKLWELR